MSNIIPRERVDNETKLVDYYKERIIDACGNYSQEIEKISELLLALQNYYNTTGGQRKIKSIAKTDFNSININNISSKIEAITYSISQKSIIVPAQEIK